MSKPKILVIGAGPSGMFAAGEASKLGADVTILEKKPLPGIKLRITGKGRCNLTNIAPIP
ncbi:MAG: FAD-binding protein, partial [Calditrichaeota bacterium]